MKITVDELLTLIEKPPIDPIFLIIMNFQKPQFDQFKTENKTQIFIELYYDQENLSNARNKNKKSVHSSNYK